MACCSQVRHGVRAGATVGEEDALGRERRRGVVALGVPALASDCGVGRAGCSHEEEADGGGDCDEAGLGEAFHCYCFLFLMWADLPDPQPCPPLDGAGVRAARFSAVEGGSGNPLPDGRRAVFTRPARRRANRTLSTFYRNA